MVVPWASATGVQKSSQDSCSILTTLYLATAWWTRLMYPSHEAYTLGLLNTCWYWGSVALWRSMATP